MKFDGDLWFENAGICGGNICIYETGKTAEMKVTIPLNLPIWAANPQDGKEVAFEPPETLAVSGNPSGIALENTACSIEKTGGDYNLVCTFDLTSQDENELEVKPEFGVRAMRADLINYGSSGIRSDTGNTAYSVEIGCDVGENVRWISKETIYRGFNCWDELGNNVGFIQKMLTLSEDEIMCCTVGPIIEEVASASGYQPCVGEQDIACFTKDIKNLKAGQNCRQQEIIKPGSGGFKDFLLDIKSFTTQGIENYCCEKWPYEVGTGTTTPEPPPATECTVENCVLRADAGCVWGGEDKTFIICEDNKKYEFNVGYVEGECVCKSGKIIEIEPYCGDGNKPCCDTEPKCEGDLVCDGGFCVKPGARDKPCRDEGGNECDAGLVCEKVGENKICKDKRVEVGIVGGNEAVKNKIKRSGDKVTIKPFELKNTGNVLITVGKISLTGKCRHKGDPLLGLCFGSECEVPIEKICDDLSETIIKPGESLTIDSSSCSWFSGFETKPCDGWESCTGTLDWNHGKTEELDLSCK